MLVRRWFVLVAVMGFMALTHCGGDPAQPDGRSDAGDVLPPSDGGEDGGVREPTPDAGLEDAGAPDAPDAGPIDAGPIDAGPEDAGAPDAGPIDAGAPDAGSEDAGVPDAGPLDAGVPDAGAPDAGPPDAGPLDAGEPDAGSVDAGAPDAGPIDAGSPDAGLPEADGGSCVQTPGTPVGGSRLYCTFNSDCPCDERCDCDEAAGCQCLTGPRGTGRSGLDVCVTGNDCESSLCVEGWSDYYCSGPCDTSADCGPRLPVCSNVAFIGRICIRNPDGE